MNIVLTYVYPRTGEPHHDEYAVRFLKSYVTNSTQLPHSVAVICNGGPPTSEIACMFSPCRNLILLQHDDSGWDNGAHQMAARTIPCDLMIFLGGNAWIKGKFWLERIVQAFDKHGTALYGAMGNNGDARYGCSPHIRTTGYWMPPQLMNEYPHRVTTPAQRYPFEHGPECLTTWVRNRGLKALVVTWTGEYEWPHWDEIPNGFHRGDQSNLIFGDRISDPPFYPIP